MDGEGISLYRHDHDIQSYPPFASVCVPVNRTPGPSIVETLPRAQRTRGLSVLDKVIIQTRYKQVLTKEILQTVG